MNSTLLARAMFNLTAWENDLQNAIKISVKHDNDIVNDAKRIKIFKYFRLEDINL